MANRGRKVLVRRKAANEDWFNMGQAIRRHRMKAGLTMDDLAKAINTGRSTIAKLEAGERKLHVGWLKSISEALNVPMENLVKLDSSPGVKVTAPRASDVVDVVVIDLERLKTETIAQLVAEKTETLITRWGTETLIAFRSTEKLMSAAVSSFVIIDYSQKSMSDNSIILARTGDQLVVRRLRMTDGPFRLEPAFTEGATIYPTNFELVGEAIEIRHILK